VPSPTEWLLTAGVVGLGLILFGLGEALLPKEPPGAGAEGDGHLGGAAIARETEAGHVRA
jgi:hypothetical protein